MSTLSFVKYSVAGNTFLILDETRPPLPADCSRSELARWLLDDHFGVGGADNTLFIAPATETGSNRLTVRFRIFEQDGSETLSCGNGLLAVAQMLARDPVHGTRPDVEVLTELPTGRPRAVRTGTGTDGESWVRTDLPRAVPAELFRPPDASRPVATVTPLHLRWWVGPEEGELTATGYLTFTGEPHLVFVLGHGFPQHLEQALFPTLPSASSVALVDRIGRSLNEAHRTLFPLGVHVNLVVPDGDGLRLRTWERAINKETMACGTGALASAAVARRLGLAGPDTRTELRPHRAGWHDAASLLRVTTTATAQTLAGRPQLVCTGTVACRPARPTSKESA